MRSQSPGKNLPRSLFLGLGICTAFYLLVNGTYIYALGMQALSASDQGCRPWASPAGKVLFGPSGSDVVAAIMLVSIFGCLNANVLVGPRIAYAMATDGLFFRGAARLSATLADAVDRRRRAGHDGDRARRSCSTSSRRRSTTRRSRSCVATIADTSALYVLRFRDPDRARPYRAAGYPWVPALYILANLAIAFSMVRARPVECLTSLGVLLAGAPVYLLFVARRRAA